MQKKNIPHIFPHLRSWKCLEKMIIEKKKYLHMI